MTSYILRRLGTGLVLALLVTFITFFLLSFSFQDIVRSILGTDAATETVDALSRELGLDRPVPVQYGEWLMGVFQGDLGTSLFTNLDVGPAVAARLGVTLSIIIPALAISAVVSVALGVWAAVRGGAADRIAQGISLIGYVVPALLLAIILVLVLSVNLQLFPATGFTAIGEDPAAWARSVAIPVFVLVIASIGNLTAQIRGSMIDELRKDYVRTLRTRGFSQNAIVFRYALRNAAGPALTVLSLEFISMLGGAIIIENVFALPGFGTYSFGAALQGDVPVIMGVTILSVLLVIVVNLSVDIANGWLNPKARVR